MHVQNLLLSRDDRKANYCQEIHAQQRSSYESGWHDTICHPIGDEEICARVGLHVAQRHRLHPPGGPVNVGQQVHVAFRRGWQKTHQGYVHMGEPACRDWDGVEWSCWLLVDLSTLALLAVAAHSCHVFAHALPDKIGSHYMLGGTHARVGIVMVHAMSHRKEDLVACSVLGRDSWPVQVQSS